MDDLDPLQTEYAFLPGLIECKHAAWVLQALQAAGIQCGSPNSVQPPVATVQCPTEADIIAVAPAADQQLEQLLGRRATQGEIYAIAKLYCQSRLGQ